MGVCLYQVILCTHELAQLAAAVAAAIYSTSGGMCTLCVGLSDVHVVTLKCVGGSLHACIFPHLDLSQQGIQNRDC